MSRANTILKLDSANVSKPKSLNVFCKLFFILSSRVLVLCLSTDHPSSRYKPMLFWSYFSQIKFDKNVPTSSHTSASSCAPIVTSNKPSFLIHLPPSLNSKDLLAWYYFFIVIWTFSSANFKHFVNRSFVIVRWKSLMSNKINLGFCLCPMFLNHSVTSLVSFHWFTLIKFRRLVFISSHIDMVILADSSELLYAIYKNYNNSE